MTPFLTPSVVCTAPDRCRAEVTLHADGSDTLIFCQLASCRETAINRIARFIRQLRAAINNQEDQHDG
jgi:hypothetical protein